jgi:DegV family protein with EDD domain
VVREAASAAWEAAHADLPLLAAWRRMADAADLAVSRTTRLLPVLEQAEVVDAGGLGLALVIRGGLAAFTGEPLPAPERLPTPSARTRKVIAEASFPRYCTELVLTGESLDRPALDAGLRRFGDSLETTGGGDGRPEGAIRIHLHTDVPEQLFAWAATLGEVSHRKVEDMEAQRSHFLAASWPLAAGWVPRADGAAGPSVWAASGPGRPIAIVTDSSADLPPALAAELGVTVVPAIVRFGEEESLDGVEIDHDTFYRRLQEERLFPTTSQPSPGQFAEAYERLAQGSAEGIVSIHLSARLSGTFNSALQGARSCRAACPVEVVDSRSTSLGMGLIVLEAARLARAGASLGEVLAAVRGWIPRSRLCAALDTLEFLAKGGRIGRAKHLLGTLVRIRPVLAIQEGEVQPVRSLRTRNQAAAFLDDFARRHRPVQALGVVYSTGLAEAEALADRLAGLHPRDSIVLGRVGPGLGSHTGPGLLGVALLQSG